MFTLSRAAIVGLLASLAASSVLAADEGKVVEAIQDYLDFAEYGSSLILPEQIPAEDWQRIVIIDARDSEQFARQHIPGARSIEWRQIPANREDIPTDRMVVVYCNTGTLSAQAVFALRLLGWENAKVLQGGLEGWTAKGGFAAYERAKSVTVP